MPLSSSFPSAVMVAAVPVVSVNSLKKQALAALENLPPFPPVLNHLMAALSGEDVSFAILGDLIEKDAVLTGWLLGAVNSVLYVRHGKISSVRHALSVLGTEKVRETVLQRSASYLLQRDPVTGFSSERFNRHSAAVAILSDLIAQRTAVQFPEGAFLAGLLHDIGRLLIVIGLPDEYQSILHEYQTSSLTWVECERKILGFAHPELSSAVLALWKVPEPIQRAVAEHHDPVPSGGDMTLGWVLNAANQYVNSSGESILMTRKTDAAGSAWMKTLDLDHDALALLLADYQAEQHAIAHYFL